MSDNMEAQILAEVKSGRKDTQDNRVEIEKLRTVMVGIDGQGGMVKDQDEQWDTINEVKKEQAGHNANHPRRLTAANWIGIAAIFVTVVIAATAAAPLVAQVVSP